MMDLEQLALDHDLLFMNDYKQFRLCKIRNYFGLNLNLKSISELQRLYISWRDQPEYLPLRYVYRSQRIFDPTEFGSSVEKYKTFVFEHFNVDLASHKNLIFQDAEQYEFGFLKSCKRGNDVYVENIKHKFNDAFLGKPVITFFEPEWAMKRTPMLYISASVDPAQVNHDRSHAWLNIGNEFNNWITQVRNYFEKKNPGCKIAYIRAWQSHKNGYPHFHILIYFKNYDFSVVTWRHPDGKISYRLPSRSKDKAKLKESWNWGFLDVVCVGNTHEAFTDLLKYVTRDLEGGESDLTNAMVWYFGKQSFGISKDLTELVWGVRENIDLASPSDADLIQTVCSNSNEDLIRIEVFPVLPASLLKINSNLHVFKGKPPPGCIDLLSFFTERGYVLSDEPTSYTKNGNIPVYAYHLEGF